MRQIILDTETTGLEPIQGHRIIEIGCIEISNRRVTEHRYHQYLQPDRQIDAGAINVHGITNEFLQGKPRFADIVTEFIDFIRDAELIIHNASFDVSFLNHELGLLNQDWQPISYYCQITDTLELARKYHPGQKNNLDALCKRYNVDNSNRQLHGALLDAEILAEVYLTMTGGQVSLLSVANNQNTKTNEHNPIKRIPKGSKATLTIAPNDEELQSHQQRLAAIHKACGEKCVWLGLGTGFVIK